MGIRNLTANELRETLKYDQNTGIFTWRAPRGKVFAGDRAGSFSGTTGYRYIRINYVPYAEHRLVFLYMEGVFPPELVDHINGIRYDNRWSNLRHASDTINAQNIRAVSKGNKSGFLGVSCQKGAGRFTAQVSVGRKTLYLGTFDNPETAHQAYVQAKRKLHAGCTL